MIVLYPLFACHEDDLEKQNGLTAALSVVAIIYYIFQYCFECGILFISFNYVKHFSFRGSTLNGSNDENILLLIKFIL